MRHVRIEQDEKGSYLISVDDDSALLCPLVSTNGTRGCSKDCAWFAIMLEQVVEPAENKDPLYQSYAYCKDHCIGEIVEDKQ